MADKKISQLPNAITPLAGSEELPVVQSGVTDKVTVANLTAGRPVSASSFEVTGSSAPANGFYLSAANTVSVATNSTQKFLVNSSGQAGLGVVPYASVGGNGDLLQIGNPLTKAGSGLTIGATSTGDIQYSNAASGAGQYAGLLRYTFSTNTFSIWTASTSRVSVDANGNTSLATGNLVVGTAGKGIDFSANGGDVLSQYDEGTWTPVITGSSSNPTVTYGLQRGKYVRVGNVVTVSAFISWSAISGGSGDLRISLPFAGESSVGASGAGSISSMDGFTFAAGRTFCSFQPQANVLYGNLPQTGSGVSSSNTTIAQMASSGLIIFSCTYLI